MVTSHNKNLSILHIWSLYAPNLFDETHPYCLKTPGVQSTLLASRLMQTQAPLLPNTHIMFRENAETTADPTIVDKVLTRLYEPIFWGRFNRFCAKKIQQVRPEVIHLHFGTTGALLLPLLRKISIPCIISFYGNDVSELLRLPRYQKKYRELFQIVKKVIVLCEEAKERLRAAGCPAEKIVLWNLPAGIEKYPYQQRTPQETTRFLTCARFVEKKGHIFLLEAFQGLLKKGHKATLTLMGYGPLRDRLQYAIKEKGLSESVRLIDTAILPNFEVLFRTELERHDIFVLPSTTAANGDDEGGPALTLVAAQAAGLPVIATPFPGAEISVVHLETGLISAQDSVHSLIEQMELLHKNRELWTKLGGLGSERVRKLFSLEGQMNLQLDIYREIQNNPTEIKPSVSSKENRFFSQNFFNPQET